MSNRKAQILGVQLVLVAVLVLMAAPLVHRLATDDSFTAGHLLAPEVIAVLEGPEVPDVKEVEAKASLDFFIMSYCPYGRKYVTDILPGLIEKYGDELDWNPRYIVSITGDVVSAMHGQEEVDENLREICIRDEVGKGEWYDYVSCFYGGGSYEQCLGYAKVDKAIVEDCLQNRAKDLVREDFELSQKYDAGASPTSVLNDGEKRIVGFSVGKVNDAVEMAVTGQIIQDAEVSVLVLTDSKCPVCDSGGVVSQLREAAFSNLRVGIRDYQTEEGKKLFEELGLKTLPAYVFDKSVEQSMNFAQMQRYLLPVGEWYILGTQGNYLPRREKIAGKVDLFVMSYCPYGTRAEASMKEVLEALGDQIELELHFLSSDAGDGDIRSLHGDKETEENIRQLCMLKYHPDVAYDYVFCRNEDLNKDWKDCLGGLDPIPIMACSEGPEGKALLLEDIELADGLGFSGSPTFLINNQMHFTGAQPPESLKNLICEANDGFEGCDQVLSQAQAVEGNC